MPTIAERRDLNRNAHNRYGKYTGQGPGEGGKHEAYQTWGREAASPEMQRLQGLAGQFGGQYGTALGQQQAVYDQFGAMAQGGGPSMADAQLQQGIAAAQQAANQQAMMARGGNAAGAMQGVMNASTSLGGQAAGQAAALKQQEMMAAMQAQGQMAGQMAGQGLQGQMGLEGMYQGALGQQFGGDIDYRLGSRGLREQERSGHNQRVRSSMGAGSMGLIGDSSGGVLSDERTKTNIEPANARQIAAANPYAQAAGGQQGGGGGIGGVTDKLGGILGLVGLLSDERTKRNISPGNLSASQVVGAVDPYTFEYEAGYGQPSGENIGVMAGDLQKAYPQAVETGADGLKRINTAQATGLTLAAAAEQEQRIRDLEKRFGKDTGQALGAADQAHAARQQQGEQNRQLGQGLAGQIQGEQQMNQAMGQDLQMEITRDRAMQRIDALSNPQPQGLAGQGAGAVDPYSMQEINQMRSQPSGASGQVAAVTQEPLKWANMTHGQRAGQIFGGLTGGRFG